MISSTFYRIILHTKQTLTLVTDHQRRPNIEQRQVRFKQNVSRKETKLKSL